MGVERYGVPDYGGEHKGAGRGDPDIGAPAAAGNLDCGCGSETGGKVAEELGISRVVLARDSRVREDGVRGLF